MRLMPLAFHWWGPKASLKLVNCRKYTACQTKVPMMILEPRWQRLREIHEAGSLLVRPDSYIV